MRGEHDFIAVYNGNCGAKMHKFGPEGPQSLAELRCNSMVYAMFGELIQTNWKHQNTLVAFAMDHGCHEIDGDCGSHSLDMPEDLNIKHFYKAYRAEC